MNKAQLADAISAETGMTKVEARKALDAFIKVAGQTLKADEKITLVGLGSFYTSKSNARLGRNPITGAPIKIAAKKTVKFRAGTELSSLLE